ncbi:unnamed protein product [Paramecium pentaurelia]|uniref:Endonuclease/exonuclease/phosphatase domain-containing protein n=1 Tax=Paramecium pentaurelia TaxID=43138 RepID=A0A8S1YHG1_9CILI|nr:unnamed protein product [Paramecium pentaurelia]
MVDNSAIRSIQFQLITDIFLMRFTPQKQYQLTQKYIRIKQNNSNIFNKQSMINLFINKNNREYRTQIKIHQKQQSSNLLIDQDNYVNNLTYEVLSQLIYAADERLNYFLSNQQESQQQPSKQEEQKGEINEVQTLAHIKTQNSTVHIYTLDIKEKPLIRTFAPSLEFIGDNKAPPIINTQRIIITSNQVNPFQLKQKQYQLITLLNNSSSLEYFLFQPTTLQIIKENDPAIICLQETRQIINTSPRYNFINKLHSEHFQGGGISIGIHKQFICRDISHLFKLDEIEYLLVQSTKIMQNYILNIHSANSNSFRNQQEKLQIFIVQLKTKKPNALKMIVRDINNSAVKLTGMIDLIPKYQITYQRYAKYKLLYSKTDIFQNNQELSSSISFAKQSI